MKYKIAFYCPDRHIIYNLHTLDKEGVGGGITARIRMAHALAGNGHRVAVYVNCPNDETIAGVRYRHFSEFDDFKSEILIVSTSGGDLDLGSLAGKKVPADLKILMVHGVECPKNIDPQIFDYVYAPSNFIRKTIITHWKIEPRNVFVVHHGVVRNIRPGKYQKRDLFKLVYFGHPSKGLDPAIQVLRLIRKSDPRYSLHVFGGSRLWGEPEQPVQKEPGVFYHGQVGQKELAHRLQEMSFSLNLQTREEPYGMVIDESMHAGCIVLARPVGAYPELVCDGYNGFLVPGVEMDSKTWEFATGLILQLMQTPGHMEYIRENAVHSPFGWEVIARAWTGHWDWALKNGSSISGPSMQLLKCAECHGNLLALADGLHCVNCGNYQKHTAPLGGIPSAEPLKGL